MATNEESQAVRSRAPFDATTSPPPVPGVRDLANDSAEPNASYDGGDQRRVPFHKVGKFVRFDPQDIDAWLASNRTEAR